MDKVLETAKAKREELGRKLVATDVTSELGTLAAKYLAEAETDFAFLISVRDNLRQTGYLTAAQAAGVLNCMAARAGQLGRTQPSVRPDPVPDGTYTIVFGDGSYTTLRIAEDWRPEHRAVGHQVAAYLAGPDNESDYAGFAFVENRSFRVWSRAAGCSKQIEALKVLLQGETWREAGEAYALRSGRCWKCARKLTVPSSLNRGLGPVCAEKM